MSNLGISHLVTIDPSLPSDAWRRTTRYEVQLSWGQHVGGEGYEGLVAALRGLRHQLNVELSALAERQSKEALEDKIREIDELTDLYLESAKLTAEDAEAKAELALQAFMDRVLSAEQVEQEEQLARVDVEFREYDEISAAFTLGDIYEQYSSIDDIFAAASAAEPGP
ncbi:MULTISPECIES: hypothetical protein [Agrobacterium]|uniref:hypothetical protein n=1 Tax=Agrobacterium TaxID=357 RepID=UPI002789B2A4|nr:hypothetical protein [Agrobacterium sp. SORGH_AS_0745]MDP9762113.1 hypothetical protein [Agrobacterium tumefaciens]MDQ1220597.1 hypothetical protein [Agrobacterium sp. SORGH_AS_0745]